MCPSYSRKYSISWILTIYIILSWQNSRSAKRQKNNARRIKLDLYSHYRYHSLEYITKGLVFTFVHSSSVFMLLKVLFCYITWIDHVFWFFLDLFQKLFRQDLLVASLFRNFLLAERIMRSYDCTPVSSPKLPPTYQVSIRVSCFINQNILYVIIFIKFIAACRGRLV
jgi:hypothetical protein